MNGVGSVTTTTEPADCATVEEGLREDCRMAVQTLESGDVEFDVRTTDLQYDAVNCLTTFTGGKVDVSGSRRGLYDQLQRVRTAVGHVQRPAARGELTHSGRAVRAVPIRPCAWRGSCRLPRRHDGSCAASGQLRQGDPRRGSGGPAKHRNTLVTPVGHR